MIRSDYSISNGLQYLDHHERWQRCAPLCKSMQKSVESTHAEIDVRCDEALSSSFPFQKTTYTQRYANVGLQPWLNVSLPEFIQPSFIHIGDQSLGWWKMMEIGHSDPSTYNPSDVPISRWPHLGALITHIVWCPWGASLDCSTHLPSHNIYSNHITRIDSSILNPSFFPNVQGPDVEVEFYRALSPQIKYLSIECDDDQWDHFQEDYEESKQGCIEFIKEYDFSNVLIIDQYCGAFPNVSLVENFANLAFISVADSEKLCRVYEGVKTLLLAILEARARTCSLMY